jgi:hypothetical protein
MKRFHVRVAVDDLQQSIGFYSALFAADLSSSSPTTPNGCLMILA